MERGMRRALLSTLCSAFLFAGALIAPDAAGRDDRDRWRERGGDIARRAVEQGQILPLIEILGRLKDAIPGRIIEVELEREDGRYVYEIKAITDAGEVSEYEVDAATAAIIKFKTKRR
jgi:uncharacterized membrane protein YkoI